MRGLADRFDPALALALALLERVALVFGIGWVLLPLPECVTCLFGCFSLCPCPLPRPRPGYLGPCRLLRWWDCALFPCGFAVTDTDTDTDTATVALLFPSVCHPGHDMICLPLCHPTLHWNTGCGGYI